MHGLDSLFFFLTKLVQGCLKVEGKMFKLCLFSNTGIEYVCCCLALRWIEGAHRVFDAKMKPVPIK